VTQFANSRSRLLTKVSLLLKHAVSEMNKTKEVNASKTIPGKKEALSIYEGLFFSPSSVLVFLSALQKLSAGALCLWLLFKTSS
jgi:hypothetical protein